MRRTHHTAPPGLRRHQERATVHRPADWRDPRCTRRSLGREEGMLELADRWCARGPVRFCVDPAGEGGGRARCRKRVSAVNQNRWRPAESQPTDVLIRVHRHWLQLHRNAHPVCGQPDSLQHGLPMGAPVEVQHGDLHAHVRMILHRRPAASPQRDLRRPQGHVLRWRTGQGSSGHDGRVRASHGPCHPPMPRGDADAEGSRRAAKTGRPGLRTGDQQAGDACALNGDHDRRDQATGIRPPPPRRDQLT